MKDNKTNIFYGVIGVATLMLSIIGATFAYFTATADNTNKIKGNMATIEFDVTVDKMTDVDVTRKGLIPMSNNMVEQALTKNSAVSGKGICVDDNNNAVCQVYKITVTNSSTASIFVDGFVILTNGSGIATDYTASTTNKTTMRWAQAFCSTESSGKVTSCTTGGNSTIRSTNTIQLLSPLSDATNTYTTLGGNATKANGANTGEIKSARADVTNAANSASAATIQGNKYEVISKNYIRVSDHAADDTSYTRAEDTTSALVYNQYLDANDKNGANNTGTSSSTFTDAQVYYIVVWLSENGKNQTVGATDAATSATGFFKGTTTFISAQGSEVTATFSGLTKVNPNTTPAT